MSLKLSEFVVFMSISVLPLQAHAGSLIGNGDPGIDLEGATLITTGPIADARTKAVALLNQLQVQGIRDLGTLIPEVEHSELYMTQKDVSAVQTEDQGSFHSDMKGLVFARTFARPHASTRFFPASKQLSEEQLIALHIHEGLHRCLPNHVRENEMVVTSLTLSLSTPKPTRDQVQMVVDRVIPVSVATESVPVVASSAVASIEVPENSRAQNPSEVGYSYRTFSAPKGVSVFPVQSMHLIQSYLYPFGSLRESLGMGIDLSLLNFGEKTQMGPLGLSARYRLWSIRGFDVGLWGSVGVSTLSNDELKNSPMGRDVATVGISMRKDLDFFYTENLISYSLPGESQYKIGAYDYTHSYGGIVAVALHAGVNLWQLKVGGLLDFNLADYFRVSGTGFDTFDTGRYRVLTAGPEVSLRVKNVQVSLVGHWMVNASQDVDYDVLGNLLGQGVGQGNLTLSGSVYF